jgi:hypothetical protein
LTAHATLNGTITATGGENCDSRGFDYGKVSGNLDLHWTENGSYGIGSFSHQVTGLDLSSTYYFRAKAHNSAGWGYASEKSFITPNPVTYRFYTPLVRMVAIPLGRNKVIRDITPIHLRKAYKRFEIQDKPKAVIV